ncbi:MAG TPA: hypothetical protein VHS06_08240 [Chloroflexota bacterium]|nr:hypothetical protein [Chloroflexota bacterium]
MPGNRGAARVVAFLLALSALALILSGCELVVVESSGVRGDAQRNAMSTAVADLPDYDIAVSAIDFDPPLKQQTIPTTQKGLKLLAAIENKGTMPLNQLVVEARLSSQKGEFSAQDKVQVDRLSPGETRVVEFAGVAPAQMLPRSPAYRIKVTVESQQSGSGLRSASREVMVRVVDSGQQEE